MYESRIDQSCGPEISTITHHNIETIRILHYTKICAERKPAHPNAVITNLAPGPSADQLILYSSLHPADAHT